MSLTDRLKSIVVGKRDELAETILQELRDACPKDTGDTARSFHIMKGGSGTGTSVSLRGKVGGDGIGSVFVGSDKLSAYYADQGNGGPNRIIFAKHRRPSGALGALKLKDGTYRQYVHGYNGKHFVEEVADRHR